MNRPEPRTGRARGWIEYEERVKHLRWQSEQNVLPDAPRWDAGTTQMAWHNGFLAALRQVLDLMPSLVHFPVRLEAGDPGPTGVPWTLVEEARDQIEMNHGQTLEQIARRGGLDWIELLAGLAGRHPRHEVGTQWALRQAREEVLRRWKAHAAARAKP